MRKTVILIISRNVINSYERHQKRRMPTHSPEFPTAPKGHTVTFEISHKLREKCMLCSKHMGNWGLWGQNNILVEKERLKEKERQGLYYRHKGRHSPRLCDMYIPPWISQGSVSLVPFRRLPASESCPVAIQGHLYITIRYNRFILSGNLGNMQQRIFF